VLVARLIDVVVAARLEEEVPAWRDVIDTSQPIRAEIRGSKNIMT
jgi:hypothetical protein